MRDENWMVLDKEEKLSKFRMVDAQFAVEILIWYLMNACNSGNSIPTMKLTILLRMIEVTRCPESMIRNGQTGLELLMIEDSRHSIELSGSCCRFILS